MPELPEVETIRLQLNVLLPGKMIRSVDVTFPKSFGGDSALLVGRRIVSVRRIAKMIVIDFSEGASLGVHLKMTGQLLFEGKTTKHTRVILHFTDGTFLSFNDQRKFGWMRVIDKDILKVYTASVGPDALNSLTIEQLTRVCKTSKRPIKILLMDQTKIAGVGNIYANEALFHAGIHPNKNAFELSNKQLEILLDKIKFVLRNGLTWGGASRTNFLDVYGKKGLVQEHFSVYDREGIECTRHCGTVVQRIVIGGRGTFFCSNCQL